MKATLNIGNEDHLLKFNKKKANIIQEERCTEIERENRILFEKLARIKLIGNNNTLKKNYFVNAKLQNEASSTRYMQRDSSMIMKRKHEIRQKEKKRIFNENMKMLERLRNSKGTIDSNSFVMFEQQHQLNLKRMQEFNSPITQSGATMRSGTTVRSGTTMKYQNDQNKQFRKNNLSTLDKISPLKLPNCTTQQDTMNHSIEQQESSYRRRTKRKQKRAFRQIDRNLTPFNQNQMPQLFSKRELEYSNRSYKGKKLLYKCTIAVDQRGKQMDLEMHKDDKKFYIRAKGMGTKERAQEIEMHLKQAQQLLLLYDNDYESFVNDSLYFKNGKFLIKDLNKQKYSSVAALNNRVKDRSYSQSIYKGGSNEKEEEKLPSIKLINQSHSIFDLEQRDGESLQNNEQIN